MLLLASGSPRRRELLKFLGITFMVEPGSYKEEKPQHGDAAAFCLRQALGKTQSVAVKHPDMWVLGADTVVALEGDILGKPQDAAQAEAMLRRLSGRTHRVFTAIVLQRQEERLQKVVETQVRFRELSAAEIAAYAATGEPSDKAGAYGIQGKAAAFVAAIHGSYTNVVGLPLAEVYEALKAVRVIV